MNGSIQKILRRVWHDVYSVITLGLGFTFALRCKSVSALMDLGTVPQSGLAKFRFQLHLSLCQACTNYHATTLALRNAIREFAKAPGVGEAVDLNKLNFQLVQKFHKPTH